MGEALKLNATLQRIILVGVHVFQCVWGTFLLGFCLSWACPSRGDAALEIPASVLKMQEINPGSILYICLLCVGMVIDPVDLYVLICWQMVKRHF